jgi:hypothetical protein
MAELAAKNIEKLILYNKFLFFSLKEYAFLNY